MRTYAHAVCIVAIVAAAVPAVAQDADHRERSDAHYKAGATFYKQGQYQKAIAELERGYKLAPHPVFLVNIALAHARLGQWQEAIFWGERAVVEPGLSPEATAGMRARTISWSRRAVAVAVADSAAADSKRLQAEAIAEQNRREQAKRDRRVKALGWAGVTSAGIGLGAIAGSVAIGASLADDREDYEAAAERGDAVRYEVLRNDIDRSQTIGKILLFTGIAGVVAGGTLFYFDRRNAENRARLAVSPTAVNFVINW